MELSRRQFLTGLAAAPLVAVSATSAYARFIEPYLYEVSETDIFLRDLPERFEGFRIISSPTFITAGFRLGCSCEGNGA